VDATDKGEISLSPITVGILEEGMDKSHPEFNNVSIDYQSDLFATNKAHGNAVVGVIGANNILGLGGELPDNGPYMNGILSGPSNSSNQYNIIVKQAFSFARAINNIEKLNEYHPEVVNYSGGTHLNSDLIIYKKFFERNTNLVRDAMKAQPNTLFVVAAGNFGEGANRTTPANINDLDNVITVGATDLSDHRLGGIEPSNYGPEVDVAAPGVEIYTPVDGVDYGCFGATSGATALVSGTAGLLKMIKSSLSIAEIRNILVNNGEPINSNEQIGKTRLDMEKAVCAVINCESPIPTSTPTPTPVPSDNIVINGSFEEPVVSGSYDTYYSGDTFGNWTVEGGSIDIMSVDHISGSYWQAADGLQSVDLTGTNNTAGAIFQVLDTTIGQSYTISFSLSGNPEGGPAIKRMEIWWGSNLLDTLSFDVTGRSNLNMGWEPHTYTANATNNLTRLTFKSLISGYYGPVIDAVSVKAE